MKLSINILNWNTMKTFHETFHILKVECLGKSAEVIVVDNGSTDGCENFATIRNPVNLGISKAKNQGIDASKGDYIMLIDGDIVPVRNSICMLERYLDDNPECMAIGFYPNKFSRTLDSAETFCTKLDPIDVYHGHCIYYGMYRKEVFQKCRFDEAFGPGYGWEDLDFYKQMERAEIKQWVAGMNRYEGKYYHAINSSLNRNCLGDVEYHLSSIARKKLFDSKWVKNVSTVVA